jgi:hypothetical protein
MSTWVKAITFALVALFLTLALLNPLMTNAQTTSSYVSPTGEMSTSYRLTMFSPDNQTIYNNTIPLNFSLEWTYDLMPVDDFKLTADYAYRIDDNPFVSIVSNQSSNDRYAGGTNFVYNPSFSYLLNVSNLSNGYHKIMIKASFYFGGNLFLDATSTPFLFLVQNPTPTPSPTPSPSIGALISPLTITIIVTVVVLVAVFVSLLFYRRHRKPSNLVQ